MQDRVVLIAPRKSGTHLAQRLLTHLGYAAWGDLGVSHDDLPKLTLRERLRLANIVMTPRDSCALDPRRLEEFTQKTNAAWEALALSWAIRLGADVPDRYFPFRSIARHGIEVDQELWNTSFTQTPANVCWVYHSLNIFEMDPLFLWEWHDTKAPAFILNVRDPRDAVVSMANYLGSIKHSNDRKTPEAQVLSPAFKRMTSLSDKIDLVLTDPCNPLFRDYERAVSFYMHPDVCKIAYEDLVGPSGGGSRSRQEDAIWRVANFLGIRLHEVSSIAETLFDPQSFTFHRGQIGSWHSELSSHQLQALYERYGYLIRAIGYEI